MKTTVELDDDLLKRAKKRAIDEGISLRALLESALRERLQDEPAGGRHSLVGWGSPGNADRAVLYDETYHQIISDIDAAMRRYDERQKRRGNDRA